jgi:uncharacterized protein (TIGR02646 family)
MRTIRKGSEPASLTRHRAIPGANYANYRDKDNLRDYLVDEQRGLCCYCLSRIRAEHGKIKIEHWRSQNKHEAEQLAYSNLLGACMGNEGRPHGDQHCDTRKGDRDLSRNPANPLHHVEEVIRFSGNGTIFSDDQVFDGELNETLNLNLAFLVNNRKETLRAFTDIMPRTGELGRGQLERWLRVWNGEAGTHELKPYCQVIIYWLRKRLSRL